MNLRSKPGRAVVLGLTLMAALFVLAGCSKKESAADAAGSGTSNTASAGAGGGGEAIFTANCGNCHRINNVGSGRKDLSHVGADPEHTADWLAAFIKDPQSKQPNIRMPAFAGKISDADLKTLSAYLAGLK